MHKLLVSLAVVASLGASSVAMAAAPMAAPAKMAPAAITTTGAVVAVSTKFCTVTLGNEGVFLFGKGCKLSKITVGEWVTITWWKSGAKREATKIVASKSMNWADMMKAHMPSMMKH